MISFCGITKRFGQRLALDDLTLDIPAGEIFGLLGHNGAGKSTAIGILLGQVWPTSGRASIDGHDVLGDRQRALARVGAIFETPVFYDYLSGYRNLEILSHYTGPTPPARIREVLDWVGLSSRSHSKLRTYSHGMRTRLALAQALLPDPRLLILDEPGDGLDPEGLHELRGMIRRLHGEFNLTILLSSHLLTEVEQVCGRIAVLKAGCLVFSGTVVEATRQQGWVRLRSDAFELAAARLLEQGLVVDQRNGDSIRLAEGVGVEEVVRALVAQGRAVYEISPQEQTLEDFYLAIMGSGVARTRQPGCPGPVSDGLRGTSEMGGDRT
ncbi:MAG: ABC transporter ATP-binding protein [Verrucomicrobia bacterium]|jgi:ABC-2 type transport system ATP-binding protein|nr:ABC transporter ATP-binding protein [Verrucomicrobiota bacterium]